MINCPQYMKEVEIEKLIEMGESSTVEFKRLLPSEIKKFSRPLLLLPMVLEAR